MRARGFERAPVQRQLRDGAPRTTHAPEHASRPKSCTGFVYRILPVGVRFGIRAVPANARGALTPRLL